MRGPLGFGSGLKKSLHTFPLPAVPPNRERPRQAWSRTVGPSQAWVVDYAITALAFGICIVYACFVGDTFTSLLKGQSVGGWVY